MPCPASAIFPHRLALSPLLPAYFSTLRPLRYSLLIVFSSSLFCSPRLSPPGQLWSLPPYPNCPVAQHTHTSTFLCHLFFSEPPRDSLLSPAVPCTSRPKTGRAESLLEPVFFEEICIGGGGGGGRSSGRSSRRGASSLDSRRSGGRLAPSSLYGPRRAELARGCGSGSGCAPRTAALFPKPLVLVKYRLLKEAIPEVDVEILTNEDTETTSVDSKWERQVMRWCLWNTPAPPPSILCVLNVASSIGQERTTCIITKMKWTMTWSAIFAFNLYSSH